MGLRPAKMCGKTPGSHTTPPLPSRDREGVPMGLRPAKLHESSREVMLIDSGKRGEVGNALEM